MKTETYAVLWDKCVSSAAEDILHLVAKPIREKYIWTYDGSEETKKKILDRYKLYRKEIREKYFYGGSNPEKKIDSHKIAACFAKAIIDVAPMKFSTLSSTPWLIKASNYAVAYYASVNIVWFFTQAYYRFDNQQYYERFKKQKYLQYPNTTDGHDSYSVGRIKALALNDVYGKELDLLAYSDMLFWIEHYNRQIIEEKVEV